MPIIAGQFLIPLHSFVRSCGRFDRSFFWTLSHWRRNIETTECFIICTTLSYPQMHTHTGRCEIMMQVNCHSLNRISERKTKRFLLHRGKYCTNYEWVSANGVAVIELTIEIAMQKWNIITIISAKTTRGEIVINLLASTFLSNVHYTQTQCRPLVFIKCMLQFCVYWRYGHWTVGTRHWLIHFTYTVCIL